MFPLGDDNSQRRIFPVVTLALIALNVLVFFVELNAGQAFIQKWAFIPSRFAADPAEQVHTMFTSMFMHGGWLHLFGNMLYLWIFGDNVEDEIGSLKFLGFYLLCGVAAIMAQFYFSTRSSLPNVGASGAIAGVLGAYLVMFPNARVRVLVANQVVALPARDRGSACGLPCRCSAALGRSPSTNQTEQGGVAYMAHVGGFVAGLALALVFRGSGSLQAR